MTRNHGRDWEQGMGRAHSWKALSAFLQLNGGDGTAPASKAPSGMSWSAVGDQDLLAAGDHVTFTTYCHNTWGLDR